MIKKDFTLGVLVMVISQFFLVAVYYAIKPIEWYLFAIVVFCSYAFVILFNVGLNISFKGVKDDAS